MSDGGLEVTPTELRFRVEPRRQIPSALSLRNPGPDRMAFKVKTTAPKKYCVRPSNGFVEACATATIQVTMQAAKGMPPESEFENCKDKFLIQSVLCDMTEQAVSSAMFDKTTNPTGVREKKVKVVLEKPSVRLDQVSEDQEPEEANGRVGTLSATAGDTSSTAEVDTRAAKFDDLSKIISERTKLKKELDKAKEERDMLKGQLDDLRMREIARDSGAVHDSANTLQASSMMQTGYAVLAALLSFVLGYFM